MLSVFIHSLSSAIKRPPLYSLKLLCSLFRTHILNCYLSAICLTVKETIVHRNQSAKSKKLKQLWKVFFFTWIHQVENWSNCLIFQFHQNRVVLNYLNQVNSIQRTVQVFLHCQKEKHIQYSVLSLKRNMIIYALSIFVAITFKMTQL